jgi:hypothetical protein
VIKGFGRYGFPSCLTLSEQIDQHKPSQLNNKKKQKTP